MSNAEKKPPQTAISNKEIEDLLAFFAKNTYRAKDTLSTVSWGKRETGGGDDGGVLGVWLSSTVGGGSCRTLGCLMGIG